MTEPSIVVPDWQRNYSWKAEQIDTFWYDLHKFFLRQSDAVKDEYFLGSIVIVNTHDGQYKLLDGQQRLATSAILLSVIRDRASKFNMDAGKQIQSDYLVGYDHVEGAVVHKLRLNIYDRDYFRMFVLEGRNAEYVEPEAKIASHHLIKSARVKFEAFLDEFTDGMTEAEAFKQTMSLSKCLLSQMTVISVYSSDEESAADVFETLNDRGIGLSTPDLLRNLIIRRSSEGAQDTVVELWRDLISFDTDLLIQNFIRHFWVSRHGDVKTQSLYREIKGVILDKDLDSVELSTSLSNSSDIYRQILAADTQSKNLNNLLEEIKDYGSRSRILLPALLALIEVLGAEECIDAANLVHNVFVRHSIIRNLENSPFENVLYSSARDLRADKDVANFQKALTAFAPDDESTENAFINLSEVHSGSRRNMLKRFERKMRTTEELDVSDTSSVHVEHVYPQKPKAGNKWDHHDRIVNRIGNLTLLSARLNRTIQNGSFADKKATLAGSELLLTKEVSKYQEWNLESINKRQTEMSKLVAELWPI